MKNNTNKITQITLDALFPFRHHPFHIQEDASMETLMDSIAKHGVSEPVLVVDEKKIALLNRCITYVNQCAQGNGNKNQ